MRTKTWQLVEIKCLHFLYFISVHVYFISSMVAKKRNFQNFAEMLKCTEIFWKLSEIFLTFSATCNLNFKGLNLSVRYL